MNTSKVVSIKKIGRGRVMNLTVDNNHTFVTANGIVTHNCDHAPRNSTQPALRNLIEEYAKNCRFVITGNYKNKIIDPIFSRCPIIDFNFTQDEKTDMLRLFIRRIADILSSQEIAYDKKELVNFCKSNFPDFRQTLNLLQMNSHSGELKLTSLGSNSSEKISDLINILKSPDISFWDIKTWTANNSNGNDSHLIRRAIYDNLKEYLSEGIPESVLLMNKYDVQDSQVVDKENNMVCFLLELATSVKFR